MQEVTYEIVLFFTKPESRAWSDIIITVEGHEIRAATRETFKPGPGETPAFLMKRFEVRAGKDVHLLFVQLCLPSHMMQHPTRAF